MMINRMLKVGNTGGREKRFFKNYVKLHGFMNDRGKSLQPRHWFKKKVKKEPT